VRWFVHHFTPPNPEKDEEKKGKESLRLILETPSIVFLGGDKSED